MNLGRGVRTAFFLVSTCIVIATPRGGEGSIQGKVLDVSGVAVADAHVYAWQMNGSKIVTILNANTNDFGNFVFSSLPLGDFRLAAEKPEAGYRSTQEFFDPLPAKAVKLTTEKRAATETINLGPQAGILTGWVRNAPTGKPIAAHLSFAPVDGHAWSTMGITSKFKFRILIPPDTPLQFGVCSDGYAIRPRVPLELKPGSQLEVDIRLEPSQDRNNATCMVSHF